MAEAQLVLEGVTKIFGSKPDAALRRFERSGELGSGAAVGVRDVSLAVPKGRTFVLMGLSGSGKSTLLRLMNGLYRPTAGRVRAGGVDLAGLTPREWPEAVVKTAVVSSVLEALGYETSSQSLSVPLVLKGVSTGDLDVFVETWWPSMASMVTPYLDDGSLTVSARNLEGTLYRAAVPTYVYEAGVTSLTDLAANAERFGNSYYGIEPGNDGNEIMRRAIAADTYGLSGWTLVESSEQGMLAAVERAVRQEEWIVFSGWRPHWMNTAFEMSYLDDPENLWGGEGYVATVANTDYLEQNPNLARFFGQVRVTLDDQAGWIDLYGRQGQDPQEVADGWIRENLATVLAWADGVTATDGEAAAGVLKAAFGAPTTSN